MNKNLFSLEAKLTIKENQTIKKYKIEVSRTDNSEIPQELILDNIMNDRNNQLFNAIQKIINLTPIPESNSIDFKTINNEIRITRHNEETLKQYQQQDDKLNNNQIDDQEEQQEHTDINDNTIGFKIK